MEVSSVSRRYAGALYDFAVEQDAKDAVRDDCAALLSLFNRSTEFADFVMDPTIPPADMGKALVALFQSSAHSATLRFLRFIASRKRLDQLPAICEVYEQQICDDLGMIKVKITAAHELSDAQLTAMKQKLHDRHKKEIDAEVKVDPSLIGGFKIQVGDSIRDFSMATQLERFEQCVINAKHEHPKQKVKSWR